jgi:hypothetical protein
MRFARAASIIFFVVLGVLIAAGPARADVIETTDGTHLVGHVTKIADGKVYVDTDFAGSIIVLQTQVLRLETDGPVAVRLVSGRRADGKLSGGNGQVQVAAATGPVNTTINEIAASWAAGARDPQSIKPKHHWAYEVSVDVNGKNGTHDQLGSDYGVRATLTRLKDTFVFSTSYNRQVTDGVKSADQFKAGADYTDNYADRNSWYVRDEGGFDRIKDLGFYNVTATGVGYDFVKRIPQTLTGRLGLAFRYEDYTDPTTRNVKSIGLDLELRHTLHLDKSLLTTRLEIVPTFETFCNVWITHETDFDVPLSLSSWKLRIGVSNDFTNKPADDVRKLDTTYFGRLVLSWR